MSDMHRGEDRGTAGLDGHAAVLSVCLVEDHEGVRTQLSDLLVTNGCDVVAAVGTASSGERAVLDLRPHVAVIDGRLPDGSGVDLCGRLRTAAPEVPLILYSAQLSSEEERAARELGVAAVVRKSLRMGDLIEAIHEHARR
jgi:two-component system, NarL family, response regulator DevR